MDSKFEAATAMGADLCVNPSKCEDGDVKPTLLAKEKWGYDYTFDCTGVVQVMRTALEVAHRGWGESCVIGKVFLVFFANVFCSYNHANVFCTYDQAGKLASKSNKCF